MHADLTPGAAGGGAFAFGLNLLAQAVGWGYPRGGAAKLAEALVARYGNWAARSAAVPRWRL